MEAPIINRSPRVNGNTARALKEVADTLAADEPWQPMHFIR